jgi:hypothetical protein
MLKQYKNYEKIQYNITVSKKTIITEKRNQFINFKKIKLKTEKHIHFTKLSSLVLTSKNQRP